VRAQSLEAQLRRVDVHSGGDGSTGWYHSVRIRTRRRRDINVALPCFGHSLTAEAFCAAAAFCLHKPCALEPRHSPRGDERLTDFAALWPVSVPFSFFVIESLPASDDARANCSSCMHGFGVCRFDVRIWRCAGLGRNERCLKRVSVESPCAGRAAGFIVLFDFRRYRSPHQRCLSALDSHFNRWNVSSDVPSITN